MASTDLLDSSIVVFNYGKLYACDIICIRIHVCVCIAIHTYVHIYIHTHMHKCTCSYSYTSVIFSIYIHTALWHAILFIEQR